VRRDLLWFGAWAVVGALFGISVVSFIGVLTFPIALVTAALVGRLSSGRGGQGVVSGLGLPLLLIAYLHRYGPGEHCEVTATSHSCEELLNPWPWLLAGAVLVLAGTAWFARRPGALPVVTSRER
jgi:hypothetical protein